MAEEPPFPLRSIIAPPLNPFPIFRTSSIPVYRNERAAGWKVALRSCSDRETIRSELSAACRASRQPRLRRGSTRFSLTALAVKTRASYRFFVESVIQAPSEYILELADLELPASTQAKLQTLMERNNEGALPEAERAELQALVDLCERIALIRGRARTLLRSVGQ